MGMLDGKAVVITGAGQGIGAAFARGVAAEGARVVVNDIAAGLAGDVVASIEALGGTASACIADVTRWDEASRLVAHCIEQFGRIDGLVNNAGLHHLGELKDYDPAAARALVEVNVLGPMNCAAHAVKPMLAQRSGSIVNLVSGAHMGLSAMGVYGASKGAVASMVYSWAVELAGTGVRVNGLSPMGLTRMTYTTTAHYYDAETQAKFIAHTPPPEANAPVLEYLLSDRASAINGQIVRIDQGDLQLCTHPALLIPAIHRDNWTAEAVAEAFERDLAQRQVPCGIWAMENLPVQNRGGFWDKLQD